jgi:hypothetical protein
LNLAGEREDVLEVGLEGGFRAIGVDPGLFAEVLKHVVFSSTAMPSRRSIFADWRKYGADGLAAVVVQRRSGHESAP